jgi:hypothetical protein
LRAREGRETNALNCKPNTNLKEKYELSNYSKTSGFILHAVMCRFSFHAGLCRFMSVRIYVEVIYIQSVVGGTFQSACGWEKKNKKKREGKNSFWGGEKNTLLKTLVVRLPCAVFKSVFFCGWLSCWSVI